MPVEVILLILTIVYATVGMLLLFAGYRIFDALTPTDMQKKIFEEGNVAVAVLAGAFLISLALVIAAAVSA